MISEGQPNLLQKQAPVSRVLVYSAIIIPVLTLVIFIGMFTNGNKAANIAGSLDGSTTPQQSGAVRSSDAILSDTDAVGLATGLGRDSVRWFDQRSGKAFEGDLRSGTVKVISDQEVPGFASGIWIPGEQQAFLVTEDARMGRRFQFYDYRTGSGHVVDDISLLAVSPHGTRIAYVGSSTEGSMVVRVANIDGGDPKTIFLTRLGITDIVWKGEDALLLSVWKSGATLTDLVELSLDGTLSSVVEGKENLEFIVSDQGSVLTTYHDPSEDTNTAIIDPATAQQRYLLEQTSAKKCAWAPDGNSLLCGIPRDASQGQGSSLAATDDRIVTIDAQTGAMSATISTSGDRVGVYSPVLSSSGTRAAYIDLFDRRVHMVNF